MILIKKLPVRKNKRGTKLYLGLFLCPYCLQEVERDLYYGKKAKSCGCVGHLLAANSNRGTKRTEEQRLNYSKAKKGTKHKEESIQKMRESHKGKIPWNKGLTSDVDSRILCGENNGGYGVHRFGEKNPNYGNGDKIRGEKHWNWQNGKSFEEYPKEFKQIKKFILERDNYKCQCPDCEEKEFKLVVHHIDYDKNNNSLENLVSLCRSCHGKTNGKNKRKYFTEYFQNIMMDRIV